MLFRVPGLLVNIGHIQKINDWQTWPGHVCSGSRLCENVHGQRMRRIVFSIGFSRQWSPALLVFKSTKSRWNFYKKILRGSFHTAWVKRRNTHPEEMFSALH